MNVRSLLSSFINGSLFGGSRIGRVLGWAVSVAILSTILYLLSQL